MQNVLETNNLSKKYGSHLVLSGITMKVPKGAIYGLVGRNGAGKTTLMRVICGLQEVSSGSYELYGVKNTDKGIYKVRSRMGAVIEKPAIYSNLTAAGNLKAQYEMLGLPKDEGSISEILQLVGLTGSGSKKSGKFSLGMKQRLGIALWRSRVPYT